MGDLGLIPGLGRSPGKGKGYPLQYSGLENSMDCTVHRVEKSQTRLSDLHFASLHLLLNFQSLLLYYSFSACFKNWLKSFTCLKTFLQTLWSHLSSFFTNFSPIISSLLCNLVFAPSTMMKLHWLNRVTSDPQNECSVDMLPVDFSIMLDIANVRHWSYPPSYNPQLPWHHAIMILYPWDYSHSDIMSWPHLVLSLFFKILLIYLFGCTSS